MSLQEMFGDNSPRLRSSFFKHVAIRISEIFAYFFSLGVLIFGIMPNKQTAIDSPDPL